MRCADITELTEQNINTMSAEDLVANAKLIWDITDDVARSETQALFMIRANVMRCKTELSKVFKDYNRIDNALNDYSRNDIVPLQRDAEGRIKQSIDNILAIMREDKYYSGIKYNLIANSPEIYSFDDDESFTVKKWCDADEAASRNYLEKRYGLYNQNKHNDALRILWKEREYNPIRDIVDDLEWDGKERVELFLREWGKVEDTPYTREVSRLIFAGAIARLYVPGIKFDDVPVLVGKQGCGKSSLVRFLALNDRWFAEIKEVQGQAAIEQLDGAFVCEIAELAAITKAKELESVKAFITRQSDKYRKPFDRNTSDVLRRCIFIGTTNNPNFLLDLTGNRRFYPVTVNSNGYDLFDHEQECRDYILQCYAEARDKWQEGEMPNFASRALVEDYRAAQEAASQDDWRIGAIAKYLDSKAVGDYTCIRDIAHNALSLDVEHIHDPTPKESKEIGLILSRMDDWERCGTHRFAVYGVQKAYCKTKVTETAKTAEATQNNDDELPF